jgi:starch synthase
LAIVATGVDGINEVVSDGIEGVLVPPEDPTSLAAAMLRLCDDGPARRAMGNAGREKVRDKFSLGRWSQELVCLYESLLRGEQRA